MAVDVGEAAVGTVVPPGELSVVDAKELKYRRLDVVDLGRVLAVERLEAPIVAGAVVHAPANAASTQQIGEHKRVLIAPGLAGELGGLHTAWPAVIEGR